MAVFDVSAQFGVPQLAPFTNTSVGIGPEGLASVNANLARSLTTQRALETQALNNQLRQQELAFRRQQLAQEVLDPITNAKVLSVDAERWRNLVESKGGTQEALGRALSGVDPAGLGNALQTMNSVFMDPEAQRILGRKVQYDVINDRVDKLVGQKMLKGANYLKLQEDLNRSLEQGELSNFNPLNYIEVDYLTPLKDVINTTVNPQYDPETGQILEEESSLLSRDEIGELLRRSITRPENRQQAIIDGLLTEQGDINLDLFEQTIDFLTPPTKIKGFKNAPASIIKSETTETERKSPFTGASEQAQIGRRLEGIAFGLGLDIDKPEVSNRLFEIANDMNSTDGDFENFTEAEAEINKLASNVDNLRPGEASRRLFEATDSMFEGMNLPTAAELEASPSIDTVPTEIPKDISTNPIIKDLSEEDQAIATLFLNNEKLQDEFFDLMWLPVLDQEVGTLGPHLDNAHEEARKVLGDPADLSNTSPEGERLSFNKNYNDKLFYLVHHHGLPKAIEFINTGKADIKGNPKADEQLKIQFNRIEKINEENPEIDFGELIARLESDERGHLSVNSGSSAIGKHQILFKANKELIRDFIISQAAIEQLQQITPQTQPNQSTTGQTETTDDQTEFKTDFFRNLN